MDHGAQSGIRSMFIWTTQSQWTPSHPKSRNYGLKIHMIGIINFLTRFFDHDAVQAISSTTPVPSDGQDLLRWRTGRKGNCSPKEIYSTLSAANVIQLPTQGSRSIQPQANHILCRAWKSKTLPPLIKTFTWRLIRRALATAERASRCATHIDKHCATCGQWEWLPYFLSMCTPNWGMVHLQPSSWYYQPCAWKWWYSTYFVHSYY